MGKSKRSYYCSPYGVWLTDRDIKNYTPPDERRGYAIMALGMGVLGLAFAILALAGVPDLIAGAWIALALLCFTLLFVFAPLAWSRNLASRQPEIDPHYQLDAVRANNFWYERGVSDICHSPANDIYLPEAPEEAAPRHD